MQTANDKYRKEFISGTIALNALVFTQWHPLIPPQRVAYRIAARCCNARAAYHKGVSTYLFDHLTLSAYNLRHGRWWTLLTSAFSHQDLPHLAGNMLGFFSAATSGFDLGLGIRHMTALAVGSALAGSVAMLAHERWVLGYQFGLLGVHRYSVGASGMVYGMLVGTMLCAPKRLVQMGNVAVEQWVETAVYVAWNAYELLRQSTHASDLVGPNIAYACHLGGAVFGAAYWWLFLRTRTRRGYTGCLERESRPYRPL